MIAILRQENQLLIPELYKLKFIKLLPSIGIGPRNSKYWWYFDTASIEGLKVSVSTLPYLLYLRTSTFQFLTRNSLISCTLNRSQKKYFCFTSFTRDINGMWSTCFFNSLTKQLLYKIKFFMFVLMQIVVSFNKT